PRGPHPRGEHAPNPDRIRLRARVGTVGGARGASHDDATRDARSSRAYARNDAGRAQLARRLHRARRPRSERVSERAFREALERLAPEYGLAFDEETLARFERHYALLLAWNRKVN